MPARIGRVLYTALGLVVGTLWLLTSEACAQPWVYAAGSVRHMGMASTGSVIDDPWAGTLNPGALAPGMHGQQLFIAYNDNDLSFHRVHTNSFVAVSLPPLAIGRGRFAPSIGVAYAGRSQTGGIEDISLSDGTTADFIDRMRYRTVGVVVDAVVQVAAGATWFNAFNSVSEESDEAHDVGVFARVPILDLLTRRVNAPQDTRFSKFRTDIAVSAGYTWSNRGDIGELFDYNRFGLGAEVAIHDHGLSVIQITVAREKLTWTIPRSSKARWGWEFNIGDALAFRAGDSGNSVTSSYGFSIHSRGLIAWLHRFSRGESYAPMPWSALIVDMYYDYAHESLFGNNSSISEFGFRFDARPLFDL